MKRAFLLALSLHGASCDSLWDAYLSQPPPCGAGTTACATGDLAQPADAARPPVPDLAAPPAVCRSSAECSSASDWCNPRTQACEPLPTLRSVYLPDSNTVWAVGDKGLILKLADATNAASTWQPMERLTTAQLNSVHGLGAGDIWAVGADSTVLGYNGTSWSAVQTPEPGLELRAVYSALAGSTIRRRIVATSGARWFLNGTGTQWQKDTTQLGNPALYGLTIPVVVGAFKTWAVGLGGALLTEDAGGWAAESSMTTADLYAACTDTSAVWAVGRQGVIRRILLLGSWMGTSSGTTQDLRSIHGSSGSNVWTVGDANTVLRYNGTAWSANGCSFRPSNFLGVYVTSTSSVWVVGEQGSVCFWDGARWSDRSLRP